MKPSEIILDAVEKLDILIAYGDQYAWTADHWHWWDGSKCHVSLSGAYAASALDLSAETFWEPMLGGPAEVLVAVSFLDYVGLGWIGSGLEILGVPLVTPDRVIDRSGHSAFRADVMSVASDLGALGL